MGVAVSDLAGEEKVNRKGEQICSLKVRGCRLDKGAQDNALKLCYPKVDAKNSWELTLQVRW